MELYVGMDVSLKETSICVVDGSGEIVSEGTVISEPAAIAAFIEAKAGCALRIGLETGPTTTWLWHELRALTGTISSGIEVAVPSDTISPLPSTTVRPISSGESPKMRARLTAPRSSISPPPNRSRNPPRVWARETRVMPGSDQPTFLI